jgi:hypothetical protein
MTARIVSGEVLLMTGDALQHTVEQTVHRGLFYPYLSADASHRCPSDRELQRIIQDAGHIHGEAHPAALAAKSGLSDIYYQEGPWDDAIRLRH